MKISALGVTSSFALAASFYASEVSASAANLAGTNLTISVTEIDSSNPGFNPQLINAGTDTNISDPGTVMLADLPSGGSYPFNALGFTTNITDTYLGGIDTHSDLNFAFGSAEIEYDSFGYNSGTNQWLEFSVSISGLPGQDNITDVAGTPFTFSDGTLTFIINPNIFPNDINADVFVFGDSPTVTPLPSAWAMMLTGLAGIGFAGYRRSRKASLELAIAY